MPVTRPQYDVKALLHQCVKQYIQKKGLDRDVTEADVKAYIDEMASGNRFHAAIQTQSKSLNHQVLSINHNCSGWAAMNTRALPALQPFNDRWYFTLGIQMNQLIWKIYWDRKANPPKDPPVFLQPLIGWYGVVGETGIVGRAITHLLRS